MCSSLPTCTSNLCQMLAWQPISQLLQQTSNTGSFGSSPWHWQEQTCVCQNWLLAKIADQIVKRWKRCVSAAWWHVISFYLGGEFLWCLYFTKLPEFMWFFFPLQPKINEKHFVLYKKSQWSIKHSVIIYCFYLHLYKEKHHQGIMCMPFSISIFNLFH